MVGFGHYNRTESGHEGEMFLTDRTAGPSWWSACTGVRSGGGSAAGLGTHRLANPAYLSRLSRNIAVLRRLVGIGDECVTRPLKAQGRRRLTDRMLRAGSDIGGYRAQLDTSTLPGYRHQREPRLP